MRNIHIIPDDKFIKVFVQNCREYDICKNTFLSIVPGNSEPEFPVDGVKYLKSSNDVLNFLYRRDVRRIYLHSLGPCIAEVLRKIQNPSPITWVLYGSGVYRRLPFYRLYESRTLLLTYFGYEKLRDRSWLGLLSPLKWARCLALNCRPLIKYWSTKYSLRKLDSIAFWLRHDYEQIRYFYSLDVNFIDFVYGSSPLDLSLFSKTCAGINSILLGNSANPTNNHVDALYNLQSHGYAGQILCPLSYSGSGEYVERVVEVGKRLFGSRFRPLTAYLQKSEYFNLLGGIDAAYFYHRRQQAGGNIRYFLSRGKPVFLHPRSPVLPYYCKSDVPLVYPASDFCDRIEVGDKDIEATMRVLRKRFSPQSRYERYRNLLTYKN